MSQLRWWAFGVMAATLWMPERAASQASTERSDAARLALAHGNYAEAVRLSLLQTGAHPTDVRAWVLQALALDGAGRSTEALASVRHALEIQPDFVPAAEAGAQIAYRTGDPSAEAMVERVLRLEPANSTAHAMAGVLALELHHCHDSLAHLQAAGSLPPLPPADSLRLAACDAEEGREAEAEKILAALHEAQPQDATVLFDLASVYLEQHRYADAVRLLEPQRKSGVAADAGLLNLLGAAFAGNEEIGAAVDVYRMAIARAPREERNYMDLAMLSMDHQSPEVALGVLDAGIRMLPQSAPLYTMRGSVHAQVARNDAASADFEMADRLAPSQSFGAIGLGVLLRDESQLDEAQQVLETKLKGKKDDPVLSYMLADILIRKGAVPADPSFADAERLLHSAIAKQPDLAQAHAALGKLELKAGRNDQAIGELEAATRLDPRDRTALNQLVAAYRRSSRTEDADRVAAQLARAVAEERAQETERNRVHLILETPAASANAAGAQPPQ